ncbi:MAG: pyridoxal-phosphate dependent enzyme [SAR324 cluster bacterium]|jgi:cystathionine beta-synthase|nr:pyridoxal-phosphate dependent enzyme [SAR324 cluster bacterium]MEE1575877.1 pyridoxal-phosphate dependent enzyme [Deltaproteobacteria bacterium]MDP6246391.1 pyridoxal-phosphate dependent enzyme [SAR324 cluster bacterium]MDP6464166.1 pyridoxal-phosphate dependent enzyme [SAR324 cluster bacterium]MDP7138880.1 pyridoxal-phosphate dependent enzyme [SAR324 cluster bacterium]
MPYSRSVLEMIGNTPMHEITRIDTGVCRLFVKLENQNPGGSIKDRIGLSIIEDAEKEGQLKAGGTIIEATAGNTGLGLALVAAQKGYRLILIIPDKMSADKVRHLRALGAEIILTRSDVPKGHPEYYQDMAERMVQEIPGAFWASQFDNPANPKAHETGTGPEIWEQMEGNLDAFVAGVGSGGTISGVGRFLKLKNQEIRIVVADPEGSVVARAVKTGEVRYEGGSWLVEGIGEDFIPDNLDLFVIDEGETVSDTEAFAATNELLRQEGILGGSSTGTLLAGALKWCRKQSTPKRVVTLVCDTGNKYLSKAFDEAWLQEQGLTNRKPTLDLRDLIVRRADEGRVVMVGPGDTLNTAYGRMRANDVSQLPVLDDNETIIGLLDEEDLLLAVHDSPSCFADNVSQHMTTELDIIDYAAGIDSLFPIFKAGKVAIVQQGPTFLGLITRVDLINHLRRKVP